MKIIFAITILGLIFNISTFAQTQREMNENSCDSYHKTDKKLNEVYKRVLKENAEDTLFIKKFKAAQRLWVQLRDADLEARFLPGGFYGSVEPMCHCAILDDMTKQRIKYLRLWIDGIDHQEACKGTVKEK